MSLPLAVVLLAAALIPARAASFSSGSTGAYGDLIVPANTTVDVDVPPDGVFHCGRLSIGSNGRLRLRPNALNTPVYILCTNDVAITGTLDASGKDASGAVPGAGGPGGFAGGYGGFGPNAPQSLGGDGRGPGGGKNADNNRVGTYASTVGLNNRTYGNVLIMPLIGGSGSAGVNGNPGYAGGGGGGAVLIASDKSIIINGAVDVSGGYGAYGGGSGGAVRLVSPSGGGGGAIRADGGAGGGPGRIRIDCEDPNSFRNLTINGTVTRGNRMFVFPPNAPSLHIVHAAGQDIPVGTQSGVNVQLPAGSPASQTVRVRGVGFTQNVQVQIVATPEHGPSVVQSATLNVADNPSEAQVQVDLPAGQQIWIDARVL